ncbi:flagellar basal body L-ring protein FlgH [Alteriqipengyuania lutimaris]|uniref:Flagellar L-ring protein n=1 Tax=Alteriqipengyuania lutimaris TaxID=1538146 RepID=A0A395LL00_9SPHN|nr:flagellar basal body L-ring protein FlgH [Alteriqipengyuania lutimaris]MBB3033982.1 flagellar L-ring protein precursor FlgH [Alteriqipengyuania lutimaris]RDS77067.1 flagellar basal body L-ring protein FlgH [Alteriqipengyuania lutimaris]
MNTRILIALPIAFALAACGASTRPAGFAAALPPAPPPTYAAPPSTDGAIYQASHGYAPLYNGNRASQVGDLVTIVLVERTVTSKATSSKTTRDGSAGLTLPDFVGIDQGDLSASAGSSFNGQGNAAQTSTLRGDLTVTIADVRPNGTAFVRGEKVMQLSQGEEWVQVSGIIRLADIDQDNRISSIRVADARISYSGEGAVQQSSRPGWLSRFFNVVSPF